MKRNLFAELVEGLDALAAHRAGKATLRTHTVHLQDLKELSPRELVAIRERLNMSRPLFAHYLCTKARTLENWEQGRAQPNAQAVALIRLVDAYPETLARLAELRAPG